MNGGAGAGADGAAVTGAYDCVGGVPGGVVGRRAVTGGVPGGVIGGVTGPSNTCGAAALIMDLTSCGDMAAAIPGDATPHAPSAPAQMVFYDNRIAATRGDATPHAPYAPAHMILCGNGVLATPVVHLIAPLPVDAPVAELTWCADEVAATPGVTPPRRYLKSFLHSTSPMSAGRAW